MSTFWLTTALTVCCFVLLSCGANPPPASNLPAADADQRAEAPEVKAALVAEPPIWKSADEVQNDCAMHLAEVKEIRAALVRCKGARSVENTLVPMNEIFTHLAGAASVADLLTNVHPAKAVREAAENCYKEVLKQDNDLKLDRELFDAISALSPSGLDAQARRFYERLMRDYRRAGVDKDAAIRKQLAQDYEKMVEIGQQFDRTVREDKRFVLLSQAELKGLPKDFLEARKPDEKGLYKITTDLPDYIPVLTYADSEKTRKALYLKFLGRAYPANDAALAQLLGMRHKYATTLGYADYATYNAEDKMVKEKKVIAEFVDRVAGIASVRAEKDVKDILARKKRDPQTDGKTVHEWDRHYYMAKIRSEKYGVDPQAVRAYFDFTRVQKGIMELVSELFGVTFERVENAAVWHESVQAYDVFQAGRALGRIYLDMHPREGKYGHMAMFPMLPGIRGLQLPSASLVCNFPQPAPGKPVLMEHSQVVTLFHEFGHLMHHVFGGDQRWAIFSGTQCEWDFVEVPSQLMEEWAFSPQVLRRFAVSTETGQPIPAELVVKMKQASEFGKGAEMARQSFFAALSFNFHAQDPAKLVLLDELQKLQKRYSPYPYEKDTYQHASLTHLNGYSSMYYTYQWSLVIAKDLFSRFEKSGLLDKATAAAYREAVLAPGGAIDARQMVTKFLGREYAFDAFRSWLEGN